MRILFFFCYCFLLLQQSTAQSALGIAAAPMKLNYNSALGTAQSLRVTLHNPSASPLELQSSLVDWYRDSTGNIVDFPEGSLPTSCAAWIRLSEPGGIVIEPGGKKEVLVSILVPDSAKHRFYNSMLYFTQLNPNQKVTDANGVQIKLAVRVGIQILYTPAGLFKKSLEVQNFWNTLGGDSVELHQELWLKLKNDGDIIADGSIDFECLNLQSGKISKLPVSAFYTLPGAVRVLRFRLPPELPTGNYQATAMIDFGKNEELKIATLEFRIP